MNTESTVIPVPDTFPGMFWGYLVLWLLLTLYILSLGVRLKGVEKKLKEDD